MSDKIQLCLHRKEKRLVCKLFFVLLLALDIGSFFALSLLDGLLDLLLLDLLTPLLAHGDTTLLDVVALYNFVLPEVPDLFLFVLLGLPQVDSDLLQVEGAIGFIAVGHQLGPGGLALVLLLELEVGDSLRSQVHLDGGLVGLVVEVPDVDAVVLRDEDDTRSGRGESAAGVLRATGVSRAEDRLLTLKKTDLPDGEVEIVNRQQQIVVEGRALESQNWARVTLRLVDALDVLSRTLLFSLLNGSDAPVNERKLALVTGGPERRSGLIRLEQNTRQAELTALSTVKLNCQEGSPRNWLASRGQTLQLIDLNAASVPNVDCSIFGAGNEVVRFALIRHLAVNLYRSWHELEIGNVVLVRLIDVRHDELLHLDSLLLAFVFLIAVELVGSLGTRLDTAVRNDVIRGAEIPGDELTIDATANQDLGILRRELDGRDFDRSLKGELCEDDLAVREVQDQHLRLKRLAHHFSALLKAELLNDAHRDEMRLLGVELNASNGSVLGVARLIEELAGHCVHRADFGATRSVVITQLLEIVLEDIDDFVGLKLALNARRHAVNEIIKLLRELLIITKCIGSLTDEILRVVAGDRIDASVVVGLRLNVDHAVSGLQTDFKLFPVEQVWLTSLLLECLQIVCALTGLLVDELTIVVVTELAALHSNARLDQRPTCSQQR